MILASNLNLFYTNSTLLRGFFQAANEGVNSPNTLFVTFAIEETVPGLFISLCINLCILSL